MSDLHSKRGEIVINIEQVDGLMVERCRPWFEATNDIDKRAALEEFIAVVLEIIHIAGNDPKHRDEIVEQAKGVIIHLANEQSFTWRWENADELRAGHRHQYLEKFNRALINTLLDKQYKNSLKQSDPDKDKIDEAAQKIRSSFKKTIDVFVPANVSPSEDPNPFGN